MAIHPQLPRIARVSVEFDGLSPRVKPGESVLVADIEDPVDEEAVYWTMDGRARMVFARRDIPADGVLAVLPVVGIERSH